MFLSWAATYRHFQILLVRPFLVALKLKYTRQLGGLQSKGQIQANDARTKNTNRDVVQARNQVQGRETRTNPETSFHILNWFKTEITAIMTSCTGQIKFFFRLNSPTIPNNLDSFYAQMQQVQTCHTDRYYSEVRLNLCIWEKSKWVYLFECQLQSIADSLSLCLLMVWLSSSPLNSTRSLFPTWYTHSHKNSTLKHSTLFVERPCTILNINVAIMMQCTRVILELIYMLYDMSVSPSAVCQAIITGVFYSRIQTS